MCGSQPLVENAYRVELVRRKGFSLEWLDDLKIALNRVLWAFEGGAWTGGKAPQVYAELAEMKSSLVSLADSVEMLFDAVLSVQDPEVDPDSWQAKWIGPRS